ncbi:unnamed protein product [Lymnaea stagnalis]|uniref:Uncharacterized protein n=1 Tax=Lymnaea stagnalis TaxID=6523 RepID=A0AAV2H4I1_LYMST
MNRWIFVGLICTRLYSNAIKIIGSDKKVFTLYYDSYCINFSKEKYNEFIQCLCSSSGNTSLMVSLSSQNKTIEMTETMKCVKYHIPLERLPFECILTSSKHTKEMVEFKEFNLICRTKESDIGNTKTVNTFTVNSHLKLCDKCFHINWWSDGQLTLGYHDEEIRRQSEDCRLQEITTKSTSNVEIIFANSSKSTNISDNFRRTNRDKTHSISTIAYVISAIFIGCIVTFFLGVKRISLNTIFRRHFSVIYSLIKPKSRDTDHISNFNDHEQAFGDPIPQTIERFDRMPLVNEEDIFNEHMAFWHRETNSVDLRANESVSEALEQETCLNNIMEDNIYADPVMILNLLNSSSNETQTTKNQRSILTDIPTHSTVAHEAIQVVTERETNVRYYEVEFKPVEYYDSQTVHETTLKSSAENDVTTATDVDKVYETPLPITDTIYYTLRRKANMFKHNYECIPIEIDSSHTSLTVNEGSRLSTFYEIAFDEEEDGGRQMIHRDTEIVTDENRGIIVDSENPIFDKTIYSSLREKRTFKHNYEIIATVMESPCIHLGENSLKIVQEIAEQNTAAENLFDNQTSPEPNSSTDKEHDDIMTSIEGVEDTNRHTAIKDVSCTFPDKIKSYIDLDSPYSSSHLQLEMNLQS